MEQYSFMENIDEKKNNSTNSNIGSQIYSNKIMKEIKKQCEKYKEDLILLNKITYEEKQDDDCKEKIEYRRNIYNIVSASDMLTDFCNKNIYLEFKILKKVLKLFLNTEKINNIFNKISNENMTYIEFVSIFFKYGKKYSNLYKNLDNDFTNHFDNNDFTNHFDNNDFTNHFTNNDFVNYFDDSNNYELWEQSSPTFLPDKGISSIDDLIEMFL